MFAWLFGKVRVWYRDDEMIIIKYRSREGCFYVGCIDTQEGFLENRHTLGAVARSIEATSLFRNNFLTMFERLGFALKELGHDPVRTVGGRGLWFFDHSPSMLFVASLPPSRSAYQVRTRGQFARSKRLLDKVMEAAVIERVEKYKAKHNEESA